jgi:cyclomaltodextrinase
MAHQSRPALTAGLVAVALLLAVLRPAVTPAAELHDYSHDQARPSPAWVRDGVIYEIFPRDFSGSGDFAGVTAQLDRLRELGVNILWLMPIHPPGKLGRKGTFGSPYAVRDYYAINPDYGTAADLRRLVAAAHQRGLKLIIDIVANHTSWDSVLMKTPEYYVHDAAGKIVTPQPDWTDVAKLDYDNPRLRRYIIDMLAYWIREFDLDGFRCDVALFVPTAFWEQARAELARLKPDIVMLAEAEQPDLLLKAFDLDYAWDFHAVLEKVVNGQQPASALRASWLDSMRRRPRGALTMRFTDNHDQRRALSRFGERAALASSALMFTLDGVPLLYNGMEVGDSGESAAPALFEKFPIFWPIAVTRPVFPRFYRGLIALRAAHPALRAGEVAWLGNSDETRVLTFLRRAHEETVLVAVNLSSQPFVGVVEGAGAGFEEITPVAAAGSDEPRRTARLPELALGAWDYRVFSK